MVDDFEAIHDPSSSSTTHHKEGHNLRQVTFQTDIILLSFVDKVSVPLSDNIKRATMFAFANQPELMKQCIVRMPALKDITLPWLHRYSFYCIRVKTPTWLTNYSSKARENHRALVDRGSLRVGKKSDIIQCLSATLAI